MSNTSRKTLTAPARGGLHGTITQDEALISDVFRSSSQENDENSTPTEMLSSKSSAFSNNNNYSLPHRVGLTHSQYTYCDQDSNQPSSELLQTSMPTSRALLRIEQRLRAGLSTPESALTISPITLPSGSLEKRTGSHGSTESTPDSDAQILHQLDCSEGSNPYIFKPRLCRTRSTRSLENTNTGMPLDEWEEAGTQRIDKGRKKRVRFLLESKHALDVRSNSGSGNFEPITPTPATRLSSINHILPKYNSKSIDSAAETNLRASLKKDHEEGIVRHKSSSADNLRDIGSCFLLEFPDEQLTQFMFSDDSGSEFGFIEPCLSPKPFSNVTPGARSRMSIDSLRNQGIQPEQHQIGIDESDNGKINLNTSSAHKSILHTEPPIMRGSATPILDFAKNSGDQHIEIDARPMSTSPQAPQGTTTSRGPDINSRESATPEHCISPRKISAVYEQLPKFTKTSCSLSQVITCANQPPLPAKCNVSPVSPTIARTEASEDTGQRLSITLPMILFNRAPQFPLQTPLSTLPIEALSRRPFLTHPRQGLSFAEASAIVYAIIAYTAIWLFLNSIGEDVDMADIVSQMGVAFLAGAILCVWLHWSMSGSVAQIPRSPVQLTQVSGLCVAVIWGPGLMGALQGCWNNFRERIVSSVTSA